LGTQVSTSRINFTTGETIFQVSGATGGVFADATTTSRVVSWDLATKTLTTSDVDGTFITGGALDSVIGQSSGAEYLISSSSIAPLIIPSESSTAPQGDNEAIEQESQTNDIFNFSDIDPWSEGNI